MTDLNTQISTGDTLLYAEGINTTGQITVQGYRGGASVSFLLTPTTVQALRVSAVSAGTSTAVVGHPSTPPDRASFTLGTRELGPRRGLPQRSTGLR